MLFFNDQVLPRANHRLSTLQQDIARKKPTFALKSQVLNEISPGRFSLKADYIDQSTSWLKVVTIYDFSDPVRRRTIYADSGKMELAGDDLLLTLHSGSMQEVPKNDPTQLQRLFYDIDRIRVKNVVNDLQRTDTTNTYKGDREMSICEMQKEFVKHDLDYQVAQYSLQQALVSSVHELATGQPAPPLEETTSMPPSAGVNEASSQAGHTLVPKGLKPRRSVSIGSVYCALMAKVEKSKVPTLVKPASAAEPPRQAQQGSTPQQGTPKVAAQKAAPQPPPQDTSARRPAPRRILMNGSTGATPVATPAPNPAVPAGAKDLADTTTRRDTTAVPAQGGPAKPNGLPGGAPPVTTVSGIAAVANAASAIDAARGRMLENKTTMNRYGVEIQKKFALSAACIVFVLIGAPIALRFPRGGVGLVIGVSLGVFAIYYVGLIAGESLADRAFLTPFWAMWAANVILTGVGLVLLARMGREGATSRGGDMTELTDAIRGFFRKLVRRPERMPSEQHGIA